MSILFFSRSLSITFSLILFTQRRMRTFSLIDFSLSLSFVFSLSLSLCVSYLITAPTLSLSHTHTHTQTNILSIIHLFICAYVCLSVRLSLYFPLSHFSFPVYRTKTSSLSLSLSPYINLSLYSICL